MSWVLIAVIALLAIFGIVGYVKGLIKIVVSIATLIITILIASILSPILVNVLRDNTTLYAGLEKAVYNTIMSQNTGSVDGGAAGVESDVDLEALSNASDVDMSQYATEISRYISDVSKDLNLPSVISDSMSNLTVDSAKQNAVDSINDIMKYSDGSIQSIGASIVATRLTAVIFKAIVYIIVFIVVFIILKIATLALDIISRLPVIKQANKAGGLAIGLVEGLIAVWILFVVITASGSMEWAAAALADIGSNPVLAFLYDINPVIRILF